MDRSTLGKIFKTGISYDDYLYKFKVNDPRVWVYDSSHNFINVLGNMTKASLFYKIPLTTMHNYIKSAKLYKNLFYFCLSKLVEYN